LFLLFEPTAASTSDLVRLRLGGTPASFTLAARKHPFQPSLRVYLVREEVAAEVRTRFDHRLHFVGQIVPDRNGRGLLDFRLPPLDSGVYIPATWCPGCAAHSAGRTFFVQPLTDVVPRYRERMKLNVTLPDASRHCPVTRPSKRLDGFTMYGNGFLSTHVATDGGLLTRRDPDGTFFTKLGWLPRRGFAGTLTVRGDRLDAPAPPMHVLGVHWGHSSSGRGSWASAVAFPSEGCWGITGRVGDISLSYVVRVIGV
jgi:hypothetical protein